MYRVQIFNTEVNFWQDHPDIQPSQDKTQAEDAMTAALLRCSIPLRMRVIKQRAVTDEEEGWLRDRAAIEDRSFVSVGGLVQEMVRYKRL